MSKFLQYPYPYIVISVVFIIFGLVHFKNQRAIIKLLRKIGKK